MNLSSSARVARTISSLTRDLLDSRVDGTEKDIAIFRETIPQIVTAYHEGLSVVDPGNACIDCLKRCRFIPHNIVMEVVDKPSFDVLFEMSLRGRQSSEWEHFGSNIIAQLLLVDHDFASLAAAANWWEWADEFRKIYDSRSGGPFQYDAIYHVFSVLLEHSRDTLMRPDPQGRVWLPDFIRDSFLIIGNMTWRTRYAMLHMISVFLQYDIENRLWAKGLVDTLAQVVTNGWKKMVMCEKQAVIECFNACVVHQNPDVWEHLRGFLLPLASESMFDSLGCFVFSVGLLLALNETPPDSLVPCIIEYTLSLRNLEFAVYGFDILTKVAEKATAFEMNVDIHKLIQCASERAYDFNTSTRFALITCVLMFLTKIPGETKLAFSGNPSVIEVLKDILLDSDGDEHIVWIAMLFFNRLKPLSIEHTQEDASNQIIHFLTEVANTRNCEIESHKQEWDGFRANYIL